MSTKYDYKKYAILYVDDEEQALKYFRKAMDKEFQVLVATNVAEANAILDKSADTIGVVITDQRMPGTLGVELLKRLRAKWPGIIRLLITAYSEIDDAIDAVNSGAIFKYVTKPADLKELRVTLTAAMELFLSQLERDTLLKERLGVIQRMIVADRVRSLAAMAGGISHHLRNSMTALTCFLEEAAAAKSGDAVANDPHFTDQLWALAQKERQHLLQIVHRVAQTTTEPENDFAGELTVTDLVGRAVAAAAMGDRKIETKLEAGDGKIKLDSEGAATALKILLKYVARLSESADPVMVTAEPIKVGGTAGIRVRTSAGGKSYSEEDVAAFFTPFAFPANDPSDLGVELLRAFSVAYQHGGDIVVNREAPSGPGFDLLLPLDPAQVKRPDLQEGLLEKLFTHFETITPTPVPAAPAVKAA
jgi:two-component system probable response regulator PhcQ